MSEIYYINKKTLTNIADAIRAATGGTEAIEVGKLGQRTSEAFVQKEEERDSSWITRNISGHYENNKIENIGSYAFADCKLTLASFPACTTIENSAFYSCRRLTSVFFPVCTSIGNSAFAWCGALTSASFPICTDIKSAIFYYCTNLTSVSFPVCTNIGHYAFGFCTKLTSVSFPVCTNIDYYAFAYCSRLASISFPVCTSIGSYAFYSCTNLTSVSLPACTTIGSYAFANCSALSALTLGASTVCALSNSKAFYSTPYTGYSSYFSGTPHIYVPSSLIASYQAATNWTYFSSYFKAIGTENEVEISFTINEVAYTAINGMTWAEWCDSSYNTAGYSVSSSDGRISKTPPLIFVILNNEYVYSTDLITESNYIASGSPIPE